MLPCGGAPAQPFAWSEGGCPQAVDIFYNRRGRNTLGARTCGATTAALPGQQSEGSMRSVGSGAILAFVIASSFFRSAA